MPTLKLFRLLGARARTLEPLKGARFPSIEERTREEVERLCKEFMPSGSGFNSGTTLEEDASNRFKLTFVTAFHHITEHGMYDGWTQHKVIVRPEFDGLDIRVTGRDRNGIKEYIGETFYSALHQEIDVTWDGEERENTFKRAEA